MLTAKDRNKVFENPLAFFKGDGLSEEERRELRSMLGFLVVHIGENFRPGNCRSIPALTGLANRVCRATSRLGSFRELVPKRYLRNHYFLTMPEVGGDRIIIVDPTGVPEDFSKPYDSPITPYFGLREYAPDSHRKVYSAMEDMDDWGIREFPPGFHP